MLGKQSNHADQPECVTVEALVPANHVLRRLHAALDLSFVRERVAPLYSRFGRPSVDPELVVRMWILQQFYGFSERQLCDELAMHAGFRWFCGLSFADPVPDQSTLVKLRTEMWANSGLFEAVLAETVRLCEAAGIARPGAGQRLGIDGTQIDANAAIVSLEAIPPELIVLDGGDGGEGAHAPQAAAELPSGAAPAVGREPPSLRLEAGGQPRGLHRSGDPDWHGEPFRNATHRSTTDPEARLYRKSGGQEAKLRYLGHYLADVRGGVIYGAMATQATGTAERAAALSLLDGLVQWPAELAADLGYRDGEFLAASWRGACHRWCRCRMSRWKPNRPGCGGPAIRSSNDSGKRRWQQPERATRRGWRSGAGGGSPPSASAPAWSTCSAKAKNTIGWARQRVAACGGWISRSSSPPVSRT